MVSMRLVAGLLAFAPHLFGAAVPDDVCLAEDTKAASLLQSRSHSKLLQDAVFESHKTTDVECLLLEEDIEYPDHEDKLWTCQLDHGIVLEIAGLQDAWVSAHAGQLISGRTRLSVAQAAMNSTTLTIPDGAEPTIVEVLAAPALMGVIADGVNTNTPLEGDRVVLVLRVIASDAEVTFSASELGNYVFGTLGDAINLKERFESCSYGKLAVTPFAGTTTTGHLVENGVADITIGMNVIGETDTKVQNAVTSAADTLLGDLASQFDHVILVLPPGTSGSWIGYAYVNYWLSVYNDEWALSVSMQVHEIGHNLNLAHAGESKAYDDQSGYMGYSYNVDDGPAMCYNGAKNWQLGWYADAYALADPRETEWTGTLIGVASYEEADAGMYVVLKLETGAETDYYVSFNYKSGINAGTKEGGNKVLVHTTGGDGSTYSESVLEAKLGEGESFDISDFGGTSDTVTITVDSIDTDASPASAKVTVSNSNPSVTPAEGWFIGEPAETCAEVCTTLGSTCDEAQLLLVDTEEELQAIEAEVGSPCTEYADTGHPYSPYIFIKGWQTGKCDYGISTNANKARTCDAGTPLKVKRFCPCGTGR